LFPSKGALAGGPAGGPRGPRAGGIELPIEPKFGMDAEPVIPLL